MRVHIISFVTSLVSMLALDAVWLGIMVKRFYAPRIGHLMGESMNPAPAVVFYPLYALCLVILVIGPSIERGLPPLHIMGLGAVYGLAAYGTYDLTNQATLRNWPLALTCVDMLWGAVLTGTISVIAAQAAKH